MFRKQKDGLRVGFESLPDRRKELPARVERAPWGHNHDLQKVLPRGLDPGEREVVLQHGSSLGSHPGSGGPAQAIEEEEGGVHAMAFDRDLGVVAIILVQILETAKKVAAAIELPRASVPRKRA